MKIFGGTVSVVEVTLLFNIADLCIRLQPDSFSPSHHVPIPKLCRSANLIACNCVCYFNSVLN